MCRDQSSPLRPGAPEPHMPKNLLILHLESITRQSLAVFGPSFPHLRRLMQDAVVFENFFSSATSTLMAITYLLHGNDLEFDTSSEFEGIRPARNTRNLFSILRERGYDTRFISLNGFHAGGETRFPSWPEDLPPVWATNDFPTLFQRFDELTDAAPFAIYAWDLITHLEHSLSLAQFSSSLTDQVRRACGVADHAVGEMMAILERKGILDNTTIVIFGDHGDDYWTHGFKGGLVHGTEPYTQLTWTPCAIRDPSLAPATSTNLASTIDIAPTCLALLGIEESGGFGYAGLNLLTQQQEIVFSQNFTANQPDKPKIGVAKAFAATDDTYVLLASSRGLEMYAYRLDPGNHCNLLQFFDLGEGGALSLRERPDAAAHYRAALPRNPRAVASIAARFRVLREALSARIAAKRAHIEQSGVEPAFALDPQCLGVIAGEPGGAAPARPAEKPAPQTTFSYSITLP
jgi:arylsulfatase A-like enzyme